MRTIILEYDETNEKADEVLAELFATDLFAEVITECSEETLEAMRELREGKGLRFDSYEEMIRYIESD